MFKHLLRRPTTACLDMGERILPKLWVDSGLPGAATALQAGQDRLDGSDTYLRPPFKTSAFTVSE